MALLAHVIKLLFLDFDGVLNSKQEVIWMWHRKELLRWKVYFFVTGWIYKLIFTPLRPLQRMSGGALGYRFYHAIFKWWLLRIDDSCDFCPISCSNVQYVLDHDPDVRIVISSTWRSWGFEFCKKILKKNGIDPAKVIGRTGGWEDGGNQRGDQIKGWLDRHEAYLNGVPKQGPWSGVDEAPRELIRITNGALTYAVVDDDSDMDAVRDHFVKTSSQTGFSMFDAYAVLRVLGTKKPGAETLFDPMHD